MNHYYTINQLIDFIEPPNREACHRILDDNIELFKKVQGSTNNHQAWPGGYYDHVEDAMNIAFVLYKTLNSFRPLPFSLSDLLMVVYFHDIEKPWKYELREDGELHHRPGMESKEDHQKFRMQKLTEYGIHLTDDHINGIEYAEGEIKKYSNRKRHMGPLACVAHMCDVCSARLWFDYPDPWRRK